MPSNFYSGATRLAISPRLFAIVSAALLLTAAPRALLADIVWSGDFSTGDFRQWHARTSEDSVTFWGMPSYGRPLDPLGLYLNAHSGSGELASIVSSVANPLNAVERGPVRTGNYAARFTVRNSANGREPRDCGENDNCRIRRTEVWGHYTHAQFYDAMPYRRDRWMSVSVFVPETHDTSGSGWGPIVFQVKSRSQDGTGNGPTFAISAGGEYAADSWQIKHAWSPDQMPSKIPWQYIDKWESDNSHSHAAVQDFPNRELSERTLGNLNRGGWTDFVVHFRADADGARGEGFLDVWMHFADEEGNSLGEWVHVVEARPRVITRGGERFNRGIFYRDPGGYSINAGIYTSKSRVWGLPHDTTVFLDNLKIGGDGATFETMAPNGISLDGFGEVRPSAPRSLAIQ